jgi:hypothetical protein
MTNPLSNEDRDALASVGIPDDIKINDMDLAAVLYWLSQICTLHHDDIRKAAAIEDAKEIYLIVHKELGNDLARLTAEDNEVGAELVLKSLGVLWPTVHDWTCGKVNVRWHFPALVNFENGW